MMDSGDAPRFRAAPLDGPARLAITAAGAVILLMLWWLVGIAVDSPGRALLHPAMLIAVGIAVLLGPATVGDWLRAPVGYSVESGLLRIHRRHAKDVTFELTGGVERFPQATGLRRRGIFYGCRWVPERGNPGLRNVFKEQGPAWYVAVTDLTRAVRLDIPRGSAIVSPAEPEAFVEAARWGA